MKQLQFDYSDDEALGRELRKIRKWYQSGLYSSALFHVLTVTLDEAEVMRLCGLIHEALPEALVVGCSTAGNIVEGDYTRARVSLMCALFEYPSTRVEVLQYPIEAGSLTCVCEALNREVARRE